MKSTHLIALFLTKRNVRSAKAAPFGCSFRNQLTAAAPVAGFGVDTSGLGVQARQ